MNKFVILASLATLTLTAVSAEARDRWRQRHVQPWHHDQTIYVYEDEDEELAYYEDEFEDEVIIVPKRKFKRRQQREDIEERVDRELWWLENGARQKLEKRATVRQPTKKPVVKKAVAKPLDTAKPKAASATKLTTKPKTVASGKSDKQGVDNVQTASLSKPATVAKPKPVSGKTIGCTAGAAVVTGYGFGGVKPKACSGATYAYTATRAGKTYEIQLTAASGEITDVKKLN